MPRSASLVLLALGLAACSGARPSVSDADLDRAAAAVGCFETQAVALGDSVDGRLSESDCDFGDGTYADYYAFRLDDGARVTITHSSDDFDAYLVLYDGRGDSITSDDDGAGGLDSEISQRLRPGLYVIAANSIETSTGRYTLDVFAD